MLTDKQHKAIANAIATLELNEEGWCECGTDPENNHGDNWKPCIEWCGYCDNRDASARLKALLVVEENAEEATNECKSQNKLAQLEEDNRKLKQEIVYACGCRWISDEEGYDECDGHRKIRAKLEAAETKLQEMYKAADAAWPAINRARGNLIDKKIANTLTDIEMVHLELLNIYADKHIERISPG